jgi:hypothetical protein
MAGLIDARILQPELAGSFAAGYRGAEQARQESQQKQQQFEMNQMKLEQLKQDRAALTDLQAKLRARGQSDDPTFFFRSLIETGNPDYVAKGYEGLRRYSELQRADALLRREAPELFGPSSTAPTGAAPAARNALAPVVPEGDLVAAPIAPQTGVMREVAPGGAVGPETPLSYLKRQFGTPGAPASANALAPTVAAAPAAPATNVLAPAAAAPGTATPADANARIRELRNKILTYRSVNDPRLKSLADVYEAELKELTKTHTVGGRIVTGGGREIYTAPSQIGAIEAEIADLRQKGVKDNDPRIVARLGKIGQLSGAGAPLDITRAMAERDRLIASGRTADAQALSDFIRKQTTHAPGTTVNVSTEKKYGERFGGLIADRDAGKLDAAEGASRVIENADRITDILASGKVFTGTGANVRLQIAKALNLAGGTDTERIANTEVLISSLANSTLGAIKSSNLGAGQGFTNADRDFLEKAASGQITYDATSLRRLAELGRKVGVASIESWNSRVRQMPRSALEGAGISAEPLPIPARRPASVMNIPQAAIDMLKSGAGTREQFDAQFGPGSADRVLPKGK